MSCYGSVVDNYLSGRFHCLLGLCYGHAKCALLPCKGKLCTLLVENNIQFGTLWKIKHTFLL